MSQAYDTERSGFDTVVVGLLRDVRTFVRQEMALAQHEAQYEIGKILKAVLWFGMAVVLAGIGSLVMAAACVLLLFEYTGLPAWACAAMVSVMLLGGAWGFVAAGQGALQSVRLVPLRTVRRSSPLREISLEALARPSLGVVG
jgi:uncharacterized membrane protein YqjE